MPNPFITAAEFTASRPKRSKYGVDNSADGRARRTVDGIRYDSQLEATAAAALKVLHPLDLGRQWIFPLVVYGATICMYRADFVVESQNLAYECKGKWTADARIKVKLFKALYPEWKLVMITKGPSKSQPLYFEEWKR